MKAAMNKIVKKHYPASKLPEELRKGIPSDVYVEIQVIPEADKPTDQRELLIKRRSSNQASEDDINEAVERIRALRDEWDDR